nr:hypothetical protein [Planctomycetota bacterium]
TLMPLLASLQQQRFYYQTLEARGSTLGLSSRFEASPRGSARQVDDAATCRARAEKHLADVGIALAPEWKQARIEAKARPFYRPDVAGVAYYEFRVAPQGFIVVATGEHDHPIPHWNQLGSSISADLEQEATSRGARIDRVIKLDTLAYVGIDAKNRIVAQVGSLPPKLVPDVTTESGYRHDAWASFAELEAQYAITYRPLLENLRASAEPEWRIERQPTYGPAGWSSYSYYYAGQHAEQTRYNQYAYSGCVTGCGATAWMMFFAWIDLKASQNDARWRRNNGIYRAYGLTGSDPYVVAPRYMDYPVMYSIQEIRRQIGTFCLSGNGATYPWNMRNAQQYVTPRTRATVVTDYSSVGIRYDSLRDQAIREIVTNRTPAVIGTGWLSHYPLAYGYAVRYQDSWWGRSYQRKFYVNQGWGGSGNGWIDADTWFCGRMLPY